MVPFAPGIGDIALVVQTALKVYTSFQAAPAEFRSTAREVWSLHEVLKDIETQSKDRSSPLLRNSRRAGVLKTHLTNTEAQLLALQAALDRYNSLGSDAPRIGERARYITENFGPLREELRLRRAELDSIVELSNTDALGFMLRRVSEIFEAERRGERRSVISRPNDVDDDVFTILSQDLQEQDFTQQDIAAHEADIQAYIDELRRDFGLEQEPNRELGPNDSVSELASRAESLPVRPSSLQQRSASGSYIASFRSQPIEKISFETIFNPHINFRGIRKPNTFDVWKLAEKSWSMQRKLTDGVGLTEESDQQALKALQRELAIFDPFLILILADSSTDRDFWRRMSKIREADNLRSSQIEVAYGHKPPDIATWPFHLEFDELGQALLSLLVFVDAKLDQCYRGDIDTLQEDTARKNRPQRTLAPPEDGWRTRFSRSLKRSKSNEADTRALSAASTTAISYHDLTKEPGLLPLSHNGKAPLGAKSWGVYVARLTQAITGTLCGSRRISITIFEQTLRAIEQRWNAVYQQRMKTSMDPLVTNEADPLLVQWLLTIQGLDTSDVSGVANISAELAFDHGLSGSQEAESTPIILPCGILVGSINEYASDTYVDLRVTEGRVLESNSVAFASIHDQAVYALTTSVAETKFVHTPHGWKQGLHLHGKPRNVILPEGYASVRTSKGVKYFVNTVTRTESWNCPLKPG